MYKGEKDSREAPQPKKPFERPAPPGVGTCHRKMKCPLCGRSHDTITVKIDMSEIEALIEKVRKESEDHLEEWVEKHRIRGSGESTKCQ